MQDSVVGRIARDELGVDENLNEVHPVDRYLKVKEVITKNFGENDWFVTDACLSTVATLLLEDLANPVGLTLVGPPSCSKTTTLSFFYGIPEITFKTDKFTPASFVSQSANVSEKKLAKVDLLPKIQHKVLIVPEFAPIFQKRRDDLVENVAMLIRVFDGEGLETDSGTHGHRSYVGDYTFAWLGATTPIDHKVWNLLGKLGSRWLFLSVPDKPRGWDEIQEIKTGLVDSKSYREKRVECRNVIHEFVKWFWRNAGAVRGVKWDRSRDGRLIETIARISQLVATARSCVTVWRDKEIGYNFNQPIIEVPKRLSMILYNLARGHAIIQGRRELNEDDVRLIIEVGISSMPDDRRRVIELLLERDEGGEVKTSEIEDKLGVTTPTALAIMKTLKVLRIVDYCEGMAGTGDSVSLKPDFNWFLSEEFRELRGKGDDLPF